MNTIESIKHNFNENIQTKISAIDTLPETIAEAGDIMVQSLLNNHKILCCGNGGSAANAQHFSSNLLHRFESERPSLPAMALSTDTATITSIANDHHYENIFSHQIKALGQEGDVLLVMSTNGNSQNILNAIKAAHQRNVQVIALTGNTGGDIAPLLSPNDIEIRTPAERPSRIHESHILIIHCLCDIIDSTLFQSNYSN